MRADVVYFLSISLLVWESPWYPAGWAGDQVTHSLLACYLGAGMPGLSHGLGESTGPSESLLSQLAHSLFNKMRIEHRTNPSDFPTEEAFWEVVHATSY